MSVTFRSLKLGESQARQAAGAVAAAADMLLVIDPDGVVAEASGPFAADFEKLAGRPLVDTVHSGDRDRAAALLHGAQDPSAGQHVVLRHTSAGGAEIAVSYVRAGLPGNMTMLVGRVSGPPPHVAEAVMALESDAQPPAPEARYRHLFQTISEATILIDPDAGRIEDMNPVAASIFGGRPEDFAGGLVEDIFEPEDIAWLTAAAEGTATEPDRTIALPNGGEASARATPFRTYRGRQLMVRLAVRKPDRIEEPHWSGTLASALLEGHVDPVVLIDPWHVICWSNSSFVREFAATGGTRIAGRRLEDVVAISETTISVLLHHARSRERATLTLDAGESPLAPHHVSEVTAVAVSDGGSGGFGLLFRTASSPDRMAADFADATVQSEPIARLVGSAPLKSIVRQTTEVIERGCIEAALHLTNQNRAAAAEALGISRQSLYMKMHQFGLI